MSNSDTEVFTLHELIDMIDDTMPENYKDVITPIMKKIKPLYN